MRYLFICGYIKMYKWGLRHGLVCFGSGVCGFYFWDILHLQVPISCVYL